MTTPKWDLQKSETKLTELEALLKRAGKNQVLILCHNNPDPDSMASAYGMSFLLHKAFGVRSVLGYGGVMTRAENKAMVRRLRINLQQMVRVQPSRYYAIALLDSQPGQGNNLLDSSKVSPSIVIDHHPLRKVSFKADFHDIRPSYGAASTIITEYIFAAGLTPTRSLANALLYGLKTDTNSLVRAACKTDFMAFHYLSTLSNPRVIRWIEKPPLPVEYFRDYGHGLASAKLYRDVAVSCLGPIHSEAIVPELADLLLRIDGVSWSLVMGEIQNMLIMSVRSTSRKYKAGAVLRRLVAKIGSAGGHKEMAGGAIPLAGMPEEERQELPGKLVSRFLSRIEKPGCGERLLVEEAPEPADG